MGLIFWKSFYLPLPEEMLNDMHFLFFPETPWLNILLSLVLILLEGVLLFLASNQFKLIKNDSLLTMVSYLLLVGLFPSLLYFPEIYILQILLSLFIFLCFYVSTRDFILEILFWASFIIGILIFFNSIFIILIPLVFIYFGVIGQLNIRHLLILFLGSSLPYLLLTSYHFLFDSIYTPIVISWKDLQIENYQNNYLNLILLIIIIFASYKTFEKLSRHLVLQKHLFLFIAILSFTFMLFSFQSNSHIHLYAIVPASFLIGRALEQFQSKFWKDLYFVTLFLFVLSQDILNLTFL